MIKGVRMLLDDILPEYQTNAVYAVDVRAPREEVYRTIFSSPFITDSSVLRILFGLRELPSKLFGKGEKFMPEEFCGLDDFTEKSAFVLLGKTKNEELVFGLIGRFWDVVNTDLTKISDPEEFKAFDKPEYGKAVMNLYLEPNGDGTRLSTETRVYFQDEKYLRRFKVYWFFIGPFSGLTRKIFLNKIKANAEEVRI